MGSFKKITTGLAVAAAAWLGIKYLLPLVMPFLLGGLLALVAEPAVRVGVRKCHLPRGVATGVGVTLTLVLLMGVLSLVGALAVKEIGSLVRRLPDVQNTVEQGLVLLRDRLIGVVQGLPEKMRVFATGQILALFDGSSKLLVRATDRVPGMIGSALGKIPNGVLGLGTGLLSAFMISARLPRLRSWITTRIPKSWQEKYLPAIKRLGSSLGHWLTAQGKLAAVTWGIVSAGLVLLGIPYGILWAALIAMVDAVPVLGTGTVLVPWALICLLQGQTMRGLVLLAVYAVAVLTRAVLEPRVVGKHLGLDPLLTLLFLYTGYRLWGILGMVFAPMLAVVTKTLTAEQS